jgi:hypothetical protein
MVPMAITGAALRPAVRTIPAGWFQWLYLAATAWLVGGAFLDNWAHSHIPSLETFFTPWHAVLYSGFVACAAVLAIRWFREGSLPAGYGLSLVGCAFFVLGGIGDMLWHTFFGVERALAAVLSPTHLWLIVTGGLIITGTVRAARAGADGRAPVIAVLGAAVVFLYLGVTTEAAQPYLDRVAARTYQGVMPYDQAIQIGLFGVMLQSALLVGLVLKVRERFELPFGSLTVIVGLQALLIVSAASTIDFMVLVAVLGGLAGDLWLLVLRDRPGAFAFALPATLYAIYIGSLLLVYGTWWEVHAVTGIIVVAGLTGWLVNFVMRRPPAVAGAPAAPA